MADNITLSEATPEETIFYSEISESKFIYNDEFYVNQKDDFSIWSNFYLTGNATINSFGDKECIKWVNSDGDLAVEENLIYTRYKQGSGLLAKLFLKRDLTIKYYRKNGSYEAFALPTKLYNEYDRILADKKSRSSIIESVRKNTGVFIYQLNISLGTPQNINPQLNSALSIFDNLQKQVTLYREEREHLPLVSSLQSVTPTDTLKQETLNFIINAVNIDYYGT